MALLIEIHFKTILCIFVNFDQICGGQTIMNIICQHQLWSGSVTFLEEMICYSQKKIGGINSSHICMSEVALLSPAYFCILYTLDLTATFSP